MSIHVLSFDGSKSDGSKFLDSRSEGTRFAFNEQYRHSVNNCRQVVSKHLTVLMNSMFENLDDALYELADKADTNRVQTDYFDAMREVRKARERIESGFKSRILEGYDRFWQTGSCRLSEDDAGEQEADSLMLMNQGDLEEDLAVGGMSSRGENRYFRELYGLDQRFGHMTGGFKLSTKTNPLAPAAICAAFKGVARKLPLDLKLKLVIYKQFERKVVDTLGGLYTEVNTQLAKAGILPTITTNIRRKSHPNRSPAQHKPVNGSRFNEPRCEQAGPGYADYQEDVQAELFSTLQQLLSRYRPTPMISGVTEDAQLPVARPTDVVEALSNLQHNIPAAGAFTEAGRPVGFDIRSSLAQILQTGQGTEAGKRIDRTDQDVIDVITMLFEFILEDQNLPDAMKALLARLQIPMLKVAIIDKEFFSRKTHPARRLLNSMAQAAVGWCEKNGRLEGGLYALMESIVQRILNQFENDIEFFADLYKEFSEFLLREEQGARRAEERTTQITKGKEQLESARHQVFEEINNRLLARDQVPEVVVTLLKDGWKDVLLLTSLRKGLDSPEWLTALETMDKLLWSVEPMQEQEQRQALLQEIPQLLKVLRIGLNDISYDQHKMACLFKDLQSCHLNCLKGSPVVPPMSAETVALWKEQVKVGGEEPTRPDSVEDEGVGRETGSPDSIEKETAGEEIHDDHSIAAETLAIGTWIEIEQEEGTQVRAKLSWRSRMSRTCLFVNRKGMKVADVGLRELAGWFRNGKAQILDQTDVPLVDRALVSMMKTLKSGEATQVKPEA